MPVPPPADRRFRRSHVSPTRRAGWRRSWKKALGAAAAVGVGAYLFSVAAAFVVSSRALSVNSIIVRGNERIATGEVHALLEGLIGTSMISIDLDAWREKLLASPWVEHADLRRVFPSSVSVVLSEKRAVGIGRIDGALYLIDRMGKRIDEFGPNYAELDLPIVDGLAEGRSGLLLVDEARAKLAARVLASLQTRPDLFGQISQIDVGNVRNAVVLLKDDTALVGIGDSGFVERLQSYVDVAQRLRESVPDIDYVDLRYGDQVYVRPQRPGPGQRTKRAGKG